MIGNTGVGKSSLLQRLVKGHHVTGIGNTLGVDTVLRKVKRNDTEHVMFIWDTAGQERFEAITTAYYRDADAAVIVFDLGNPSSFKSINKWHELLMNNSWKNTPLIYLIGNKCENKPQVTTNEINKLVTELSIPVYIATSAVTGENVENVFNTLFDRLISIKIAQKEQSEEFQTIALNDEEVLIKKPKCSC